MWTSSDAFKEARENNGSAQLSVVSDTCHVGMKIPPFYAHNPRLWFAQTEGHFLSSGITVDNKKNHYVLSNLELQYAKEVRNIIISPPAENKLETLKKELVKRLCDLRAKTVQQLLMEEKFEGRKPQFLRHLKQLAGPDVPENFLKTIWTSRLPTNIQTLIISQAQ
ncbi:uncharacterized protein [Battus philenor]|uniref:uncharacterized protein n=1 Tax=Battus philenor TaxID=42288 RepID=UPI0035CEBA7A